MKRLVGFADENMADFVHGVRSQVCCDSDNAAVWKEGKDHKMAKKRGVERNTVENTKRCEKEPPPPPFLK
jgi:hypothetical protein